MSRRLPGIQVRRHQFWLGAALLASIPSWGISFQLFATEPSSGPVTLPVMASAVTVAVLGLQRDPIVTRWLHAAAWILLGFSLVLASYIVGPSGFAFVFLLGPGIVVVVVHRLGRLVPKSEVPLPPLPDT